MGLRFDFSSIEDYVANHLRLFILSVAGLVIFTGIIAVSVFFIAVRGAEQVMVPNVTGKELTDALLEMQVKELYPRIQLRYSQTSTDKGFVIEQDPLPGTIVKAGRRIRLVVSQGVIINKVENFIGRNVDEVRMELQAIFTTSGNVPLLSLKEPMMYEYSVESPGTILAQRPEPLTDISGPTVLELVVSRGLENTAITVPQLVGASFYSALELISATGINFHFASRQPDPNEREGIVVHQSPSANSIISENTLVQLTITPPEFTDYNDYFGIFTYQIPPNPYPLAVRLDAVLPSGERSRLFQVDYLGGEFTVPYNLPVGTVLILSMLNRELHREVVGG